MKKTTPLIIALAMISLMSGCVSNSHESGQRVNILFGVVDYKSDYRHSAYVYDPADAGVLNNAVVTTRPTGAMAGYNSSVDGKKLTILWGLGGTYKWN